MAKPDSKDLERAIDAMVDARVIECLGQLDPLAELPTAPPAASVDVVIPVHDAFDAFSECLASVLANTGQRHAIILIDDASLDPRVAEAMQKAQHDHPHVEVRRHPENLGYLRSVNRALAASRGDVILLNRDAVVAAGWIDGLARAACAEPRIGIACPLSDDATLLSVVDRGQPVRRSMARATRPRLPVAAGFCMYLRRPLLDAIGDFDPAFDPGYGEETDFSMRAWAAGFEIVAATDVIVLHRSSSSFGDGPDIRRRRALHERLMAARWPAYESIVTSWWRDWPLREQAERLRRESLPPRRRVLHVAHRIDRIGGTELHTRALVRSLSRHLDADMLAPDDTRGWSDQRVTGRGDGWREVELDQSVRRPNQTVFGFAADLSDPAIERALMRRLVGARYDVVHVHSQLNWNTLLIPALARAAGARVVVSVHSLESLCPNFLLAPSPSYAPCGKSRAGSDADCVPCLSGQWRTRAGAAVPERAITLDARWHAWRRAFADADVVVAPSRFVFERLRRAHGEAIGTRARVIAHGVAHAPVRASPTPSRVLRVGYFGGVQPTKGIAQVIAMAEQLLAAPVHFVIHGVQDRRMLPVMLPANVGWRPPYRPEQLDAALAGIDVAVIPSRVEETFSLVMSECHAAGRPVIASRSGAFIERIIDGETGWLVDAGDIRAWVDRLAALALPEGRLELARVAARVAALPRRGIDEEAADFAALYAQILAGPLRVSQTARPAHAHEDRASLRLRQAMRAIQPIAPTWIDDVAGTPGPPRATAALCVIVCVAAHNHALLETTLGSLEALDKVHVRVAAEGMSGLAVAPGIATRVSRIPTDLATAAREAREAGSASTWHVLIDAGDVLHVSLVAWLASHPADGVGAVLFDHDLVDRQGRHYAPAASPRWDPWLARGSRAYTHGLAMRHDVLLASGGWSEPMATAQLRMPLRLLEIGVQPGQLGRVVHHVGDINLSPQCRPDIRSALRATVQEHLDTSLPGWSTRLHGDDGGWTLSPPTAHVVPVAIVVWDTAEVAADHLERLRHATDWPRLSVQAHSSTVHPTEAEVVVFCHASLHPRDPSWLSGLLAWLQHADALAVGPRQHVAFGRPPGAGFCFDGHGIEAIADPAHSRLPHADELAASTQAVPALSTRCLAIRAAALDANAHAHLGTPDGADTVHAQLDCQSRDGRALLWVPAVPVDVGTLEATTQAPEGIERLASRCRVSPLWAERALGPRRRERAGASLVGAPKLRPRIAALTRDDWASSQYRVHLPLADLCATGIIDPAITWRLRTERAPGWLELAAESPDAVVFHHALDDRSLALMATLVRTSALPRILVIDDLLTDVPASNPMASRLFPDIGRRLHEAIEHCSVLVVTSAALAEAWSARAPRTVVIENALRAADWTAARALRAERVRGPRLRVGWAGAEQHGDEMALLGALVRRHRDVDWAFLGMAPPEALDLGAEVHGMVPFREYPQHLAALQLDIALVPLLDTPFNRCKSSLKVIESGMLGTAVLASALPPYRDAPVTHVDAGVDAWSAALARLKADADARIASGNALETWVHASQLAVHRRAAWADVLGLAAPLPTDGSAHVHEPG